jgi:site-specific DNA recombinase
VIAIYARVSTTEQAEKGYSLADQIRLCREKAESTDILEYIDDGYSGEFMGRPALDKLLKDLEIKPITHVIIYDPDRLARNSELQLSLAAKIESYAKLVFVTYEYDCSPEGKLFFTMKAGISAYEKAKILARTSRGRFSKALQGKVPSNNKPIGYGWDAEKSMYIINEKEAELVRHIFNLYIEGLGCRRLAAQLNNEGHLTKRGYKWSHKTVDDIIHNEMYAGKLQFGRQKYKLIAQGKQKGVPRNREEWVTIDVPAIITPEQFAAAQRQIAANKHFASRNTKRFYLLQGIVKCGKCGYSMTPQGTYNGNKPYYYYTCYNRAFNKGCDMRFIPVAIEDDVWGFILEIAKSGKPLLNDIPDVQNIIEENKKLVAKLEKQRTETLKWRSKQLITDAEAEAELYRISQEINKIKSIVLPIMPKLPNITLADIANAQTPQDKQRIIRGWGVKVIVQDVGDWKLSIV